MADQEHHQEQLSIQEELLQEDTPDVEAGAADRPSGGQLTSADLGRILQQASEAAPHAYDESQWPEYVEDEEPNEDQLGVEQEAARAAQPTPEDLGWGDVLEDSPEAVQELQAGATDESILKDSELDDLVDEQSGEDALDEDPMELVKSLSPELYQLIASDEQYADLFEDEDLSDEDVFGLDGSSRPDNDGPDITDPGSTQQSNPQGGPGQQPAQDQRQRRPAGNHQPGATLASVWGAISERINAGTQAKLVAAQSALEANQAKQDNKGQPAGRVKTGFEREAAEGVASIELLAGAYKEAIAQQDAEKKALAKQQLEKLLGALRGTVEQVNEGGASDVDSFVNAVRARKVLAAGISEVLKDPELAQSDFGETLKNGRTNILGALKELLAKVVENLRDGGVLGLKNKNEANLQQATASRSPAPAGPSMG